MKPKPTYTLHKKTPPRRSKPQKTPIQHEIPNNQEVPTDSDYKEEILEELNRFEEIDRADG